jgi:Zn finger protein HypA/HybF involved in hydrogenase expression
MPEVFFWIQRAVNNGSLAAQTKLKTLETEVRMMCGCCSNLAREGVTVKLCAQCKAVGYCSRDCQVKHWKMGHKVDCAKPEELKKCFDD